MAQLKTYHRPTDLETVIELLSRPGVHTALLAGGTHLTPHLDELIEEVVDLQAAGLDTITTALGEITLGAMVRLQTIVDDERMPALLQETARREAPNTLRQAATLGGLVVGADPESELLAALLVSEANVEIRNAHGTRQLPLPAFLVDVPTALAGGVVTAITVASGGQGIAERVARTPADRAIVAAVGRKGDDGLLKLALCGVAATPILVDPAEVDALNPPADFRGSSDYRRQMIQVLTQRVVAALDVSGGSKAVTG